MPSLISPSRVHDLPINNHDVDLRGCRDIGQRVRAKDYKVSLEPRPHLTDLVFALKVVCWLQCRTAQSVERRQAGVDEQLQFAVKPIAGNDTFTGGV